MNYWKCECGKTDYFESGMPPKPCQGCDICGTTLSASPKIPYKAKEPHIPKPVYDRDTGEIRYYECSRCMERLKNYPTIGKAPTKAYAEALRIIKQARQDLLQAHEEICKLQELDPTKHTWPEWTSQANTIRWIETYLKDHGHGD